MLTFVQTIAGMPRMGASLDRPEPCEGKLSRTVLRGCGRVNRLHLPGAVRLPAEPLEEFLSGRFRQFPFLLYCRAESAQKPFEQPVPKR